MKRYKMVIYVPSDHAEDVRHALAEAGAGVIGKYTHCTFTVTGIGRFKPEPGAMPHTGEVGEINEVEEERIETVCAEEFLQVALEKVRAAHPYEEPAIDVYPIEVV